VVAEGLHTIAAHDEGCEGTPPSLRRDLIGQGDVADARLNVPGVTTLVWS